MKLHKLLYLFLLLFLFSCSTNENRDKSTNPSAKVKKQAQAQTKTQRIDYLTNSLIPGKSNIIIKGRYGENIPKDSSKKIVKDQKGCRHLVVMPLKNPKLHWNGICYQNYSERNGTLKIYDGSQYIASYTGNIYSGNWSGKGVYTSATGKVLKGVWRGGILKKSSEGKAITFNGKKWILDQNNCKHSPRGISVTWSGSCINGFASGKGKSDWKVLSENGEAYGGHIYNGYKKNGMREGEGEFNSRGTSKYKGTWKNGNRHNGSDYRRRGSGYKVARNWKNGTIEKKKYVSTQPSFNEAGKDLLAAAALGAVGYVKGVEYVAGKMRESKNKEYKKCTDKYESQMRSRLGEHCSNVMNPEAMKYYNKDKRIKKVIDEKCNEFFNEGWDQIFKQCKAEVYQK